MKMTFTWVIEMVCSGDTVGRHTFIIEHASIFLDLVNIKAFNKIKYENYYLCEYTWNRRYEK